jgi:RNA polymerase sigma-70 factor (ECF subfamily)
MAEEMVNIAAFRSETPRLRDASTPLPFAQWTDENLMLEHGRGSETAFEELVRRFHRPVFNYIYRMVQNRHVGEELTQEVFMALVKNGDRYTPTAKFSTYLYTIASNIVYKEWARQKRRPKMFSLSWWSNDHEGEGESPIDTVRDENACVLTAFKRGEISEAVNEALHKIAPHYRESFVLKRFQGLSYEEIAEITDCPIGTVKSRIARAEQALRPYLEKYREYV